MKKGFVLGLATGVVLTGASLVSANSQIQAILNNQIKVTLNGQVQEFKDETTNETQYPITYKDRTYLPLRTVANLVGVDVDYDANSNTAILKTKDYVEAKDNSYIFPTSSTVEITTDLSNMSVDELELAKNEIFARYGYDFSVKTFADYFSNKSWYKKIDGKKVSVSELNAVEQKNVAYIDKYISLRKNKQNDIVTDLVNMKTSHAICRLPKINIGSENVKRINKKIEEINNAIQEGIKKHLNDDYYRTNYEYFINNNVLSVVIYWRTPEDWDGTNIIAYNIDINSGKQIEDKDILKNIDIDINDLRNKVYEIAESTGEFKQFGEYDIISKDRIDLGDYDLFLNEKGDVCVTIPVDGTDIVGHYILNLNTKHSIDVKL